MTTLEEAWQAYMVALAKAQDLHVSGAGAEVLQEPLQRAGIAGRTRRRACRLEVTNDTRNGLEQLPAKLIELEGTLVKRQ